MKDISNSFLDGFPFLFTSFSLFMQFSECVRRLCGYHFEIISTQSSSLRLLPALTCFLMNMLPSSSPGVVIQGKTSPILSGMVSLSSSLHFLSSRSSLSVSDACVAIILNPIFLSPSTTRINMFPHEHATKLISGGCYTRKDISNSFWDGCTSSSLHYLSLCSSLCVSVVCVAGNMASYTPNLPFLFHFLHEHVSTSLGVVIQGKTSRILSGMVAPSSSLLFLSLCSSLCVSEVCVAVILGSYTPNLPHSFHFPREHVSSSLGVVTQGKTSPILSGVLSPSSSLLLLPLCNSLCVSVVCVAIILKSYTPNLPVSLYFPH